MSNRGPNGRKLNSPKRSKSKSRKGQAQQRIRAHAKGLKVLEHEIARAWEAKVPTKAREAIWSSVLGSVSQCLSETLQPNVFSTVDSIVQNKDLKGLVLARKQLSSPQLYGNADSYLTVQAVLNLFGKTEQTIPGIDPLAAAVARFREAEKLCRITNRRLLHYRTFDHSARPLLRGPRVHEVFHLARRKIADWLGPVGGLMTEMVGRHGPGGVVGLKRPNTTPYYKFAKQGYTCSSGAYWYAVRAIASSDAWIRALAISEGLIGEEHSVSCIPYETRIRLADANITIAESNEVTFVPKDALTKRSISVEPELNVYLQLGVGEFLKRKLRRAGCDLSDQTRNKHLAYVGSVQQESQDPVTLDLRMASDTMAIEVVRELLPDDWYALLDSLRSHSGVYRGKSERWAKFSSMGNGFTFELESLLFLALAQAVSDTRGTSDWFADTFGGAYRYAYVSVFGDDIIVPRCDADMLTAILRYCGFQLNSEKSFVSGPFRESCGSDFWNGVDVRTFYCKRDLSRVRDLIHLHNGLKWMNLKFFDGRLDWCLTLVRAMLPPIVEAHLRGVVPTLGDEHIWCEPDDAHRSKLVTWHIHWQKWLFPTIKVRPDVEKGQLHWRYVQFLYSATDRKVSERVEEAFFDDTDQFQAHILAGGSRADVVKSGRGTPAVKLG